MAREETNNFIPTYKTKDSRKDLQHDEYFSNSLRIAKARISKMEFLFIIEEELILQASLEIYSSVISKTPYHDFDSH